VPCALAFAAGAVTAALAVAAPQIVVSQKGREFNPGEISIARGETIQILNDDGDLLHHAYIDSKRFSFDSGDQQPGSKTNILFPETGDYIVRCAIHPKMKLNVHVK
jgi:plastocyanin